MKKSILVLAVIGIMAVSCKKSGPSNEAYCVYTSAGFISCEKSNEDAQKKCLQLRDAGHTGTEAVKKSSCDECR